MEYNLQTFYKKFLNKKIFKSYKIKDAFLFPVVTYMIQRVIWHL